MREDDPPLPVHEDFKAAKAEVERRQDDNRNRPQLEARNSTEHSKPLLPVREEFKGVKAEVERRQDDNRNRPQPEAGKTIDDAEAKMAVYRKELQAQYLDGRFDKQEQIRREKLYDQQMDRSIRSTPEGKNVVLPDPQPARTAQQRQNQGNEAQGRQEFKKEPMDWERMQTDPAYRKQMEQQAKEERASRQQHERQSGPQRPGSGGRGR